MPHWRHRYHASQTGWIEAGTAALVGWFGVIVYSAVIAFGIWLMFATIPKAKAAQACQPNQIEGLAELARELGVKPSSTPTIATGIGCDGKAYDFVVILRAHVRLVRDKK